MTLVQLEYIIAVDTYKHFGIAATHCFVTQPSLSMQIQKLEDELGVKIFDRSKQPVITTETGTLIIYQAKTIMQQCEELHNTVAATKNKIDGHLRLGVIPTLAPYLLPLFVQQFSKQYTDVKLTIVELTTELIIQKLKDGRIDVGLLVTPLQEAGIKEEPLFYEELVAYVSNKNEAYKKTYMLAKDINPNKLWLLEEGHCLRGQIENLCELRKQSKEGSHFEYEAGSLETIRKMVDLNDGITILPELATHDFTAKQQRSIRYFKSPAPVREVSLVTHRDFVKRKLVQLLKENILAHLPEKIKTNKQKNLVSIA
jgi:LysR family transcriptional regulator, hydrogen peroxide-inducible genes activator